MQLTKGAIGNLINKYKSVLKKCSLLNAFGTLAVGGMLVLGSTEVTYADDVTDGEAITVSNETKTLDVAATNTVPSVIITSNSTTAGELTLQTKTSENDGVLTITGATSLTGTSGHIAKLTLSKNSKTSLSVTANGGVTLNRDSQIELGDGTSITGNITLNAGEGEVANTSISSTAATGLIKGNVTVTKGTVTITNQNVLIDNTASRRIVLAGADQSNAKLVQTGTATLLA